MKVVFLSWLISLATLPALSQSIPSKVYNWNQSSVVKQAGFEDKTILEGTTRDFANLSVHAITLFAHQPSQPEQQLDEEALIIVKAGALTLQLGNRNKTLGPGSIVVIMPGDSYRLDNKTTQPLTYYIVRYTSNEVPDLDLYRLAGGSFWVDWEEVPFTPHDKGGIRRMFDYGTVMTKRFEMHVTTLNPGMQSHPPHTHRAAEILLMVDNNAQESVNGALQTATTGDVIFLESNVPHNIQNVGQRSCTYFAFQFE
jgi:(S)-ureidoglycine aminohydrolase